MEAVMKTLLIYPELPLAHWSMPELVRMTKAKTFMPPPGLPTVAALLPKDWEVRLIDLNVQSLKDEDWEWADVVMLSAQLLQRNTVIAVLQQAKQRGKPTVVGGAYATSLPEELLEAGCDFVFQGEAENAINDLLEAIKAGETNGRCFGSPAKPDMSSSPVPRFELLNLDAYVTLSVQTSRGCPFDCEFCDVVSLFGRKFRAKSAEQVIEELDRIYRLGWRGQVFISDDNFWGSRTHALAVLEKLVPWVRAKGNAFSFLGQGSVNLGQDPELIELMVEANFTGVYLGIETPDEDVLARYGKRQNIQNPLLEAVDNITRRGLQTFGSCIIGFDGEKDNVIERMRAFVDESAIPILYLGTLYAFPNSRMWRRLKDEGRLNDRVDCGDPLAIRPNFVTDRPIERILKDYQQMWDYAYEPSRFLDRTYRYHLKLGSHNHKRSPLKGPVTAATKALLDKRRLRKAFHAMRGYGRLFWRYGFKSPEWKQFWMQLTGLAWRNPSVIAKYLRTIIFAESMIQIRQRVRRVALRRERAKHRRA
jgi:radical SAM superfamily enzyme YgiQ (UPF0313 family)